ncbi:MAG: nuclear transport factor 2 family protein [Deltaproteobacteria bacterium]|nr:nuclear transport factor 2 family protein [Deltaproteobacteria bacterium]MBW2498033.1 nuclear transport factor 2 family protein [Deltaproteobacteria bacterium]
MSIKDRYQAYADAFEESLADDDWTRLEEYFTEDAIYRPDGSEEGQVAGRDAVMQRLKGGVDQFDRRMDSREIEFTGEPHEEGSRVEAGWKVRYTKSGAPDVEIFGTETAEFRDDRIYILSDAFAPEAQSNLEGWIRDYGKTLTER